MHSLHPAFCYPPFLSLSQAISLFLSVFILRGVPDPIHSSLFKTVDPLSAITLHALLTLTSHPCVFEPLSPPLLFYPLSLSLTLLPLLSRSNLSPEGSDWQASGGLVKGSFWLAVREMKRIKPPGPALTALQKKRIMYNLSCAQSEGAICIKHIWSGFCNVSSVNCCRLMCLSRWEQCHLKLRWHTTGQRWKWSCCYTEIVLEKPYKIKSAKNEAAWLHQAANWAPSLSCVYLSACVVCQIKFSTYCIGRFDWWLLFVKQNTSEPQLKMRSLSFIA